MIDTNNSSSSSSSQAGRGFALDFILNHSDQNEPSSPPPLLPYDEAAILVSLRRRPQDPSDHPQDQTQRRQRLPSGSDSRQLPQSFGDHHQNQTGKDCNQPQRISERTTTTTTTTTLPSLRPTSNSLRSPSSTSSREVVGEVDQGGHRRMPSPLSASTNTTSTHRATPSSPTMVDPSPPALPSFRALWPCPPRGPSPPPNPIDVSQPCHPLSLHQQAAAPGVSQTSPWHYSTNAAPLLPFCLGFPSLPPPPINNVPKDPEVPLARHVLSYLRKMQGCTSDGPPCDTPTSLSVSLDPATTSPVSSVDRQSIIEIPNGAEQEDHRPYPMTTARTERRHSKPQYKSSSSDSDYETSCLQDNPSSPEPEKVDAIEQTKRVLEILLSMDSRLDINQATSFGDSSPSPSSVSSEDSGEQTSLADGRRKRASNQQVRMLEAVYAKEPFPCPAAKHLLAKAVHMSYKSITIWFQNKRARMKKRMARAITSTPVMIASPATSSSSSLSASTLGSNAAASRTTTGKRKIPEADEESHTQAQTEETRPDASGHSLIDKRSSSKRKRRPFPFLPPPSSSSES